MRSIPTKTVVTLSLLLSAAMPATLFGQKTTDSDLRLEVETAAGNALNHFDSYGAYVTAGTTQSVRDSKLRPKEERDSSTLFVIYGVDMKSPHFLKGDFIWAGDLAQDNNSDTDFDGISLPISGAAIVVRKSTIKMLFPEADRFFINGKEATIAEYEALKPFEIQCVTRRGNTLLIKKRFYTDGTENVDVQKASDDEGNLLRRMFTAEDEALYKRNK